MSEAALVMAGVGELAKLALGLYIQASQLAGKTEEQITADLKLALEKVKASRPDLIKDV